MKETRFKDTEIGRIPEDWGTIPLGKLCEFRNGYTPSKNIKGYWENGTIPWFRMEDLREHGRILEDAIQHVTNDAIKGELFSPYSIIMSTTATIGEHALIIADSLANQQFTNFSIRKSLNNIVDTMWFYWYCYKIGEWCRDNIHEGGLAAVNMVDLAKLIIPIPPLSEQTRIASALTSIDNLISSLDKLIEKKKAIKEGTMQQLLTGKKRLKGFNEPWVERKLGEIASMNSGGTPTSSNPSYYDGNINFLSISDLTASGKYIKATEKTITELGLSISSARLFPAGTLMYAMYASLGKCSISTIDTAISQAILGFKLSDQVERDFLYYHFSFIENKVKTMGQTGTQSNLSKGIVKEFSINLPSLSEQRAIACVLSSMDNEISAIQAKKAKYESIKQGMMQQLLTGRIRLV